MTTYYVTGAAGWLGKNLINRLVRGFGDDEPVKIDLQQARIRALVLPGEEFELEQWAEHVEIVTCDVRKAESLANVFRDGQDGILIHLAGVIHPRRFVSEFMKVNVEGSKNVIRAALNGNVGRAIVLSSNSPIGCNPSGDHLFDEDSPYQPYMGYGYSKMLLENYVKHVHETTSLDTVLIRAPWFYGPFQPKRQTTFFEMIRDGRAPILGDGENLRSMVFLENLVQGILLAAASSHAAGKVYWIADERPYTMNEIINTVEFLLANEFQVKCNFGRLRLPSFVGDVAYLCDWCFQKAGLYHQKIHVLSEMNKNISCSVTKAKKELGYTPSISLEEGMRQSIRYLVDTGALK